MLRDDTRLPCFGHLGEGWIMPMEDVASFKPMAVRREGGDDAWWDEWDPGELQKGKPTGLPKEACKRKR